MNTLSRYQTFCRFCYDIVERDTVEQALHAVSVHEISKHALKINPPKADISAFFPKQYKRFTPVTEKAEICPECYQKSMNPFQSSSTARQCANPDCRYVQERTV